MAEWRKKGLRPIQEVLKGLLSHGPFAKQIRDARVRQAWKEAAGDRVSRETLPVALRRGILVVGVSSPSWAQELVYDNERILAKLRERIVNEPVKRIVYKAMNEVHKEKGRPG